MSGAGTVVWDRISNQRATIVHWERLSRRGVEPVYNRALDDPGYVRIEYEGGNRSGRWPENIRLGRSDGPPVVYELGDEIGGAP